MRSFLVIWSCLFWALSVRAHDGSHQRVHQITHELKQAPKNADLFVKRGRVYRDSEHYELAVKDFVQALALRPDHQDALYWLAEVKVRLTKIKEAKRHLTRLFQLNKSVPKAYRLLAEIFVQEKKLGQAIDNYDLAIQTDNRPPPQVFIDRTNIIKLSLVDFGTEALKRIENSIQQGVNKHGYLVNYSSYLINFMLEVNNYERALFWFNKLPAKLQKNPRWLNIKASIFQKQGDNERALASYKNTLVIIDELPQRLKNLKVNQIEKNRALEAIRFITQ